MSNPAVSFSDPIVEAVVPRLRLDGALTTLLGGARVYDYVPANTPMPYVKVSVNTELAWNFIGKQRGSEIVLQTQVASSYRGGKQTGDIVSRLRAVLDGWRTTLTGARWPSELGFSQVLPAFDEEVDGVRVTYRTVLWTMRVV